MSSSQRLCRCWFLAAAVEHSGRGGGGLLSNLLQCPTVKCVTGEVPKGAKGGQPSPNVAKEQRLRQEGESRAMRTLIRGLPQTHERGMVGFPFNAKRCHTKWCGESPILPYIGGMREGGVVSEFAPLGHTEGKNTVARCLGLTLSKG